MVAVHRDFVLTTKFGFILQLSCVRNHPMLPSCFHKHYFKVIKIDTFETLRTVRNKQTDNISNQFLFIYSHLRCTALRTFNRTIQHLKIKRSRKVLSNLEQTLQLFN